VKERLKPSATPTGPAGRWRLFFFGRDKKEHWEKIKKGKLPFRVLSMALA
jgi:hypothetical protein